MELNEIKNLIIEAKESETTKLNLSYNRLTSFPPEISELKNLTTLDISGNQMTSLAPEILELKNLTELYISGNQLISFPPEISELKNLTTLDISGNQLTSFPPEISELKNLTELYINRNQLTSLPPEISELKNLTKLYIFSNELTSFPPEISELKNLTTLDISFNELTSLPPEISELKNLTTLDISSNELTSLPPEISELKNLTELDISGNQLTSLPPEISELKNLTELDISGNQLTSLPPEISELKNLTTLDISGNQLTSLPPEISELKNLTELYINRNQLTSLPPEILELKNLTELYISGNQLTSLPPEISELKNLTTLDISGNQLTSLPPEISELKNLTTLDISFNELTSFPPEILELKNLTELYISGNQLTSLPPEILELKNLTNLYISGNQLTSFPPEILELKNLTNLYISGNQLTSFPPEISELKNLTKLDISGNQLTSFPPEILELKNLTKLDISSNQLTSLPPEITELKNLTTLDISSNQLILLPPELLKLGLGISPDISPDIKWAYKLRRTGIFLEGNPFEKPPIEIIKQGKEAILNYFKSLEGEKETLNEVKVLLVGEGGAGKTSLAKRLFGEEVDGNEPQTQGINIRKLVFKNGQREIKANFWDFGGQEIMHATHQFFLSKRSLYILVLDGRKDEKPEYWLKLIENFGSDSPVLVVINKIDENPGFELNRKFLQEKYPSIRGFYRLSCKSNQGVNEFSEILREELIKIKHLEIMWPKSWFNVKNRLEELCVNHSSIMNNYSGENCNFIEYKEYKLMCDEEGIKNESEQDTLVDFLHDLGVILHFKDIPLLNTHVLEPEWVTNAIYKIVTSKKVLESKGELELVMLSEILKQSTEKGFDYPPNQYSFFVNLMKKFELAYDIYENIMLLPSLLEIQEPNFQFDYEGALKFRIDYDFLPPTVMPRFIVKMHREIKDNLRWRTGVVLENENFNSSAVIKLDNEAKRISIYVTGEQRRDYFAVIIQTFREINKSFKKLKATEKIPLPDNPNLTVNYRYLIKLELRGEEKFLSEESGEDYSVSDLLGTVIHKTPERVLLEEMLQKIEISKEDQKKSLEVLKILQEKATESDTEDTLLEKVNKIIEVRPGIPGIGATFNVNEIVNLYLKWRKKQL